MLAPPGDEYIVARSELNKLDRATLLRIVDRLLNQNEQYITSLRDLLAFWDRHDDHGWTAADVKRIDEIRKLANA